MDQTKSQNLNNALKAWCKSQGISAPNFGRRIGYTEQHAYRLLNGAAPVTAETIGRFVVTFGPDASRAWLELAGWQTQAIPGPQEKGDLPVEYTSQSRTREQ